jgi:tetratricopeptide (TPR) repeat protein
MERKYPGLAGTTAKADALRRAAESAEDERTRLYALLELARHYVDAGDGVRALESGKEARLIALRLWDYEAAAHALNSISVSQYHRSEYVNAIATALDAWDYADRGKSALGLGDSYYSIGLSLFGLGLADTAERVVEKGLATISDEAGTLEVRIRLTRLLGILRYARDAMDEAEALIEKAIALAQRSTATQLAASHAIWGVVWIRRMDEQYGGKPIIAEKLQSARLHLEKALLISEREGDALLVTDRVAILGVVAMLEKEWDRAEHLLARAMENARALDYVRASVISTVYLARLYLERGDAPRAITLLGHAIAQARRGAADDVLIYARTLLARAYDKQSQPGAAAEQRELIEAFREETAGARRRSGAEASRLVARLIDRD